jgi:hypothetical protein
MWKDYQKESVPLWDSITWQSLLLESLQGHTVILTGLTTQEKTMKYDKKQKVAYRNTIIATVEKYLGGNNKYYKIRLHDHASERNEYYIGTVCSESELSALET